MALQFEFSLNQRDRALLEDLAASLRAVAGIVPTLEKTVAAIDDLKSELSSFASDFSTFSTDFGNAVTALQSVTGSSDDAALADVTNQLKALHSQVSNLDTQAKNLANPNGGSGSQSSSGSQSGSNDQ